MPHGRTVLNVIMNSVIILFLQSSDRKTTAEIQIWHCNRILFVNAVPIDLSRCFRFDGLDLENITVLFTRDILGAMLGCDPRSHDRARSHLASCPRAARAWRLFSRAPHGETQAQRNGIKQKRQPNLIPRAASGNAPKILNSPTRRNAKSPRPTSILRHLVIFPRHLPASRGVYKPAPSNTHGLRTIQELNPSL